MKSQKQIKNEEGKSKNREWDEVSLLVHMRCDGCTTKVMRYLRGFEGLREVKWDGKSYMVIVKRKAVDPLAVQQRIEWKRHGSVEIIDMNIKANDSKQRKQKEKSSLTRIQKIIGGCSRLAM